MWTALHELDDLPQLLNPVGGYLHNENDAPWLANLRAPLDPDDYPEYFEAHEFRLRSQHAQQLVGGDERLSLEDVLRRKHSYPMLLADADQAAMFARGEMKAVAFTREDVERAVERRYRPRLD